MVPLNFREHLICSVLDWRGALTPSHSIHKRYLEQAGWGWQTWTRRKLLLPSQIRYPRGVRSTFPHNINAGAAKSSISPKQSQGNFQLHRNSDKDALWAASLCLSPPPTNTCKQKQNVPLPTWERIKNWQRWKWTVSKAWPFPGEVLTEQREKSE